MSEKQIVNQDNIFKILSDLCLFDKCARFETEFINLVKEYYKKYTVETDQYGTFVAVSLWKIYSEKGLIAAFSEYNQVTPICFDVQNAFCYALINS